jgi:hypothetical protein
MVNYPLAEVLLQEALGMDTAAARCVHIGG